MKHMHLLLKKARNNALFNARDNVKRAKTRLKDTLSAVKELAMIEKVIGILVTLKIVPTSVYISPGFWTCVFGPEMKIRVNADIHINMKESDSFKSPEYKAAISALNELLEVECSSTDWTGKSFASRSFSFRSEKHGNITLFFNVPEEGDACKRVKVGTKLVEEAQYEIVCN